MFQLLFIGGGQPPTIFFCFFFWWNKFCFGIPFITTKLHFESDVTTNMTCIWQRESLMNSWNSLTEWLKLIQTTNSQVCVRVFNESCSEDFVNLFGCFIKSKLFVRFIYLQIRILWIFLTDSLYCKSFIYSIMICLLILCKLYYVLG